MADEDDRAADPADRCLHQGDVLCRCVEAVLRCNTLIPLRQKGNDQLAEARAVGPEPVTENDAGFGLRRCHFALLYCPSRDGTGNLRSKLTERCEWSLRCRLRSLRRR